jgi:hypothetical protein
MKHCVVKNVQGNYLQNKTGTSFRQSGHKSVHQVPKVFPGIRNSFKNRPDNRTAVYFCTIGTTGKSFRFYTFPDVAGIFAMGKFNAFHPAPRAINGLCGYFRRLEHCAPFGSHLLPHGIIIPECGNSGFALFAVDPATADQFFHSIVFYSTI